MPKFAVSTDSCCDLFRSYLRDNNVYCILLARIVADKPLRELYNSFEEFERFYADLRHGALPTTSQLNEHELVEYFEKILAAEPAGDLIHLPLSSGLSGTCDNARAAAQKLNERLSGRKVYILDSLSASLAMGQVVERLVELRDQDVPAEEALRVCEELRDRQQVWIIQNSLFHLKRGGRISGFRAAVGTLLSVKPIIIFNNKGELVIENTIKGRGKAVDYVIKQMKRYGADAAAAAGKTFYLVHSSGGDFFAEFSDEVKKAFPQAATKVGMIGPIIGTHLGEGSVIILFEGAKRLAKR